MEEKFTVAEFKKYLESQDSFGDAHYFCTAENIRKANEQPEEEPLYGEDCCHFDEAQGRNLCMCGDSNYIMCQGVCECFERK